MFILQSISVLSDEGQYLALLFILILLNNSRLKPCLGERVLRMEHCRCMPYSLSSIIEPCHTTSMRWSKIARYGKVCLRSRISRTILTTLNLSGMDYLLYCMQFWFNFGGLMTTPTKLLHSMMPHTLLTCRSFWLGHSMVPQLHPHPSHQGHSREHLHIPCPWRKRLFQSWQISSLLHQ